MLRVYAALIYVFLYAPIARIVFFSFNAGRYAMDWQGFSVEWYGKAFTNPIVVKSLLTSITIAGSTAFLASIIGTACAGLNGFCGSGAGACASRSGPMA